MDEIQAEKEATIVLPSSAKGAGVLMGKTAQRAETASELQVCDTTQL